jgi:hypothetical protein
MITPKEKAEQLISNFSPYVYCYIGSGMLTNTFDNEAIKMNAKQCALIAVDEILLGYMGNPKVKYWTEVKQEIEKL